MMEIIELNKKYRVLGYGYVIITEKDEYVTEVKFETHDHRPLVITSTEGVKELLDILEETRGKFLNKTEDDDILF